MQNEEGSNMKDRRLAVDIAKGVFQGVLAEGRSQVVWKKRWRRARLRSELAQLAPCLVVMEACGGGNAESVTGVTVPPGPSADPTDFCL